MYNISHNLIVLCCLAVIAGCSRNAGTYLPSDLTVHYVKEFSEEPPNIDIMFTVGEFDSEHLDKIDVANPASDIAQLGGYYLDCRRFGSALRNDLVDKLRELDIFRIVKKYSKPGLLTITGRIEHLTAQNNPYLADGYGAKASGEINYIVKVAKDDVGPKFTDSIQIEVSVTEGDYTNALNGLRKQFVYELISKITKTEKFEELVAYVTSRQQTDSNMAQDQSAYFTPSSANLGMYNQNTVSPSDFDSVTFHALLIANSEYKTLEKLHTPKRDALVLGSILKDKYGFKVKTLIDATRNEVIGALHSYRKQLTEKDNLLIFYAGHGWLDKDADEGYWLPVDAKPDSPMAWISNSSITSTIRATKAKHIVVFSDSCYSGKLTRGILINLINSDPKKKRNSLYSRKARVVISSGGLEPVLDSGGSEGHSIFASALINTLDLNTEIIDTTSIFSLLRSKVTWNAVQVPELGVIHKAGHDGGDFIFVPVPPNKNSSH